MGILYFSIFCIIATLGSYFSNKKEINFFKVISLSFLPLTIRVLSYLINDNFYPKNLIELKLCPKNQFNFSMVDELLYLIIPLVIAILSFIVIDSVLNKK